MTNRRVDALYFVAFLLVVALGYAISSTDDEGDQQVSVELPDFSFPSIEFDLPVEISYSFVKFVRPSPPQLALTENTESVRRQLRSALLESSTLVEVEIEAETESQWAALGDGRE